MSLLKKTGALVLMLAAGATSAVQISPVEEERRWIAAVNNCNEMTVKIREMNVTSLNILSSGRDDDTNCYISFKGMREFAMDFVQTWNDVRYVEEDLGMRMISYSWGRDRINQQSLPLDQDDSVSSSQYQGRGQTIYVVDTGIRASHNEFSSKRARTGVDLVKESPKGDNNGHGTHCAGIAGGKNYGVATEAELVAVKVLNMRGSGTTAAVMEGIQWAVTDAGTKSSVISLSLGGAASQAIDEVVKSAVNQGHIVVVAAGNSNADACKYSPARVTGAITVGASDMDDKMAYFSNSGPCVDIFAPGTDILSASHLDNKKTRRLSGTSMSCPFVAGVCATLLEKHEGNVEKALGELFETTIGSALSGVPDDTENELLQLEGNHGSPTATPVPSVKRTFAPSVPTSIPVEPLLCADGFDCIPFMQSLFGPQAFPDVDGELHYTSESLCTSKERPKLENKIVIVERGGCLFFDKVKHAEENGALAVLITSAGFQLRSPEYQGGSSTTSLASAMIKTGDANRWKKKRHHARWAMQSFTMAPTVEPCEDVLKRRKCNKRVEECFWYRKRCTTIGSTF